MWPNLPIIVADVVLALGLLAGVALAMRGSAVARYFLWSWAVLSAFAAILISTASQRLDHLAIVGFLVCVLILFLSSRYNLERLEQSHNETRRVLTESNKRVEEERRVIAGALHDDVNPLILVCRNEIHRLAAMLPDNPEAQAIANRTHALLADAYKKTRELIKNTRIEIIDSIGFTAAVEALIGHYRSCFEKPTITLQHNLPAKPGLSQQVALNAYKILREAVFNAIKHSGAAEIIVAIRQSDSGQYQIDVRDDGCGLRWDSTEVGIGLIDMRERARVLGGELHIEEALPARPRPGTRVSLEFRAQPD